MSETPPATVYNRHGVRVVHGECVAAMRQMEPSSVDSVVCDPPYGIGFMGRDWDTYTASRFQEWCREWATGCLRVLKPGGHLLAFGGTRSFHRLAVGIEDAGFDLRDDVAVAGWTYGAGFPKSLDVAKAMDKAAGIERTEGAREWRGGRRAAGIMGQNYGTQTITKFDAPATESARTWHGWGTALKPAWEPIIVARKPLSGTVVANVLAHGTGALNIDGCRHGDGHDRTPGGIRQGSMPQPMSWGLDGAERTERPSGGRWPANAVFLHHPECGPDETQERCHPDCQVAELDRQSGVSGGGASPVRRSNLGYKCDGAGTESDARKEYDAGGASRFFPTFRFEAKAPTSERPQVEGVAHPTVKPLALMRWLVRLVTQPGGTVLDCFAGSGSTGQAARAEGMQAVLIERESDYIPLIKARLDARDRTPANATREVSGDKPMDLLDLLNEEAS